MNWTYKFLGNHASHRDSDYMHTPGLGPAYVVQQLYNILGHFGGGVTQQWFITVAHSSIVEYQAGVFVRLGVGKVLRLSLPSLHDSTQSHDPL